MSGTASSFGLSRIVAGANDVVWVPRGGPQGRRAVIACHGYLGTSRVFVDDPPSPNTAVFIHTLTQLAPLLVVAVDLGNTWGNATATARIEAARTYAVSLGAAATVNLLGISMGNLSCLGYLRDYTANVGAVCSIMPASDLDDIRTNNRAGAQASVDTAWGVGVPPAVLPAGANPTTNNALPAVSAYRAFYSTADTTVLPATVTALATKLGGSATVISSSADHGDVMMPSVPIDVVAAFLAAQGS